MYFYMIQVEVSAELGIVTFESVITINEPVDYMARAIMILMRGKDITQAIGRVGLKVEPVYFQPNPSNGQSNVFALHQNHKGQVPYKKQVHWYFYANEKRVVSGPKHPQRGVK